MLTDKTLELIVQYEKYRFPEEHIHKFVYETGEKYTSRDLWNNEIAYKGTSWLFLKPGSELSPEEAKRLEVFLLSDAKPEAYEMVSEFVQFALKNPDFPDYKELKMNRVAASHLIDGIPLNNFSSEDRNMISGVYGHEAGKIAFFTQYFDELKYVKVMPFYVQRLRNLL